ncbi:MAG: DNA adenine methylase [Candidatus Electrothrix sp. EH2]|nr:DNA adenine methylase [Candidatus Electrothrix sp. EH2]
MKLPHPIQYQGSKRNLAPVILKYFPGKVARLIEPFAGTGAVSVACAAGGLAEKYWLNDYNRPLAELLRLIIEQPENLSGFYDTLWNQQHQDTLSHYSSVREQFNKTEDPQLFLYLLARCVKGSVRYNREGYFNQSPDKRRKGAKPENMRKNIFGVSSLLKNKTVISSLHYTEMLSEITKQDLVYMDPPYQGVCKERDSRYYAGIDSTEFVDFLKQLNRKGTPYLISYDGKCGKKTYGKHLPDDLGLKRIELKAGRSSQATLVGKKDITYESLYLSESLLQMTSTKPERSVKIKRQQQRRSEMLC